MELFKKMEVYGEKFKDARGRKKNASVNGTGGTKGASVFLDGEPI